MDALTITFKDHVNPNHVEEALSKLGAEPSPSHIVRVDLSKCVFIDSFAGWRLGNGFRRHAERGLLEVVVPDRAEVPSEQWFKSFTRTGLGYAIAHHCNHIRTALGKDVTADMKEYYDRVEGVPAPTHLLVAGIRDRRPFNVDDFPQFYNKFLGMISKLRAQSSSTKESLHALSTFVYEGIQNIYDHSQSSPLPRGTKVFDYLCVNYHANIRNPPDVEGRLAAYLKRLPEAIPHKRLGGYMEVVVNDDGVGIAARQSQRPGIYWDSNSDEEKKALLVALARGGSIKFVTKDCPIRYDPGLGTHKIIDALRKLSAFAFIRTGRFLVYFDGSSRSQDAFVATDERLGYMPGTTLEVIVPIVESQLRLDF